MNELIDVKGWRATGNKFAIDKIKEVSLVASAEAEAPTTAKAKEKEQDVSIDDLKASIAKEIAEEEKKKFDVGSSVDLKIKKPDDEHDQLGLFGE